LHSGSDGGLPAADDDEHPVSATTSAAADTPDKALLDVFTDVSPFPFLLSLFPFYNLFLIFLEHHENYFITALFLER